MKLLKNKLTLITFTAFGFILIFYGVLPVFSSPGFSVYEFSRGMLTGLCSVAAVVWLIDLFSNIAKAGKPGRIISIVSNKNKVLLDLSMSLSLIGIILSSGIPGSTLVSLLGFIILCVSVVLNLIYLGTIRRKKVCGDAAVK